MVDMAHAGQPARPGPGRPPDEKADYDLDRLEIEIEHARASRARAGRLAGTAYPVGALVALVVAWALGTWFLSVPSYLLPSPGEVWASLLANWGMLVDEAQITTIEVVIGYAASIVVGIALGMAIFLSPILGRSVYPLLVGSQAVPKTAIAPLFVVWFGFGLFPKVLIAFLIGFFPIVISTVVGLVSIDPDKLRLARSIGLGPWSTFFKIRLPQAAPSIFGGLKIAITLCLVGAVVGEFVGASNGLGYLLLVANGNLDSPLLFAGLLFLTAIGGVGFMMVALFERLIIPWHSGSVDAATGTTM